MSRWTHAQIVDVLAEERLLNGSFPSRRDWRSGSRRHPCSETVAKRFGTWWAALETANRSVPIEDGVSVPPVVVEFALASLPADEARRVWPIAFHFGFSPPDGEIRIDDDSLERFLWRDLPRAADLEVADKVRTVAAFVRFLRVLPDSPMAEMFARTCESATTARALVRGWSEEEVLADTDS